MKKRILAMVLSTALVAGTLLGCGSSGDSSAQTDENAGSAKTEDTESDEEGWTVGVATPNNAVPFFARLNAGMEETAEKYNILWLHPRA